MSVRERTSSDDLLEARERYVARGVATPRLVVVRAEGAQVEAADGTVYLDFAGGIACQNTGHGFAPVVAAIHEQVDRYLHQCFMVGTYEPYVEVCRRLAELSPCAGDGPEVDPRQQRRRGDRERRQDRTRRDGPPGGRRLRERLPRPHAADDDDDEQGTPVQGGLRAVPARGLPRGRAVPVSRRRHRHGDRGASSTSSRRDVDAETVACVVLEPVQGEGGFIPMPADFLRRAARPLRSRTGSSSSTTRCSRAWGGPGRCGRSSTAGVEPDLLVSGKSLGGGLPLAAVTGRAEVMDAPGPGGLGGTFGGNPVACAAAAVVLDTVADAGVPRPRGRARYDRCARGSTRSPARHEAIGEVRGLGPMLALELAEQSPDEAQRITAAAFDRGLLLLSCGLYGNVLRLLPPLTVTDEELARGLELLEESLAAAG